MNPPGLRRNRVQAELAEAFGVSQSTISRAITTLTPILGQILIHYVPVAEDTARPLERRIVSAIWPPSRGPGGRR